MAFMKFSGCSKTLELLVKYLHIGYVYIHDRPDTKTVMAQLNAWFNDYNNNHPHKGLRLKSPREFIREVVKAL
jgi:transposase InsO family protein